MQSFFTKDLRVMCVSDAQMEKVATTFNCTCLLKVFPAVLKFLESFASHLLVVLFISDYS